MAAPLLEVMQQKEGGRMQKGLDRPGDPYCNTGDHPTPELIHQNPSEKGTFLILQRLCVKWCTK
jgi:hypothetical protein